MIDATPFTGKLMFHIMAAMAEFERDVIRERTQAGLEAARARGRRGGRPKANEKIEPRNLARAKELYAAKSNTIAEIMQMTGFKSRNTFYKYVVNGERKYNPFKGKTWEECPCWNSWESFVWSLSLHL